MKVAAIAAATCLSLSLSGVAFAQNAPEPTPYIQATSSNPSNSPLICKYYYYNGQVLPRRDCRTAAQWEYLRQTTAQSVMQIQQRGLVEPIH